MSSKNEKSSEAIAPANPQAQAADKTISSIASVQAVPVADAVTPVAESIAEIASATAADVAPDAPILSSIRSIINEYVTAMSPGVPYEPKSMVKHQARLLRTIRTLINLDYVQFERGMDYLMFIIKEHRAGCFSDMYIRRVDHLLTTTGITSDEVRQFDRLLSVLCTIGRASNRANALTQVDLSLGLALVPTETARQNLGAYFSAMRH